MEVISASRIDPAVYREIVGFIKENGYPPVVALDDGKLYLEEYHPDLRHLDDIGEEFIKVRSIETSRFAENTVDIYIPNTGVPPPRQGFAGKDIPTGCSL